MVGLVTDSFLHWQLKRRTDQKVLWQHQVIGVLPIFLSGFGIIQMVKTFYMFLPGCRAAAKSKYQTLSATY